MPELHRELKNRVYASTGYGLSTHAIERFLSRCPGQDIVAAIGQAVNQPKRLTKKRMNVLKRNSPAHAQQAKITASLIHRDNVVFVAVDKKIVTTFIFDTK